jgi:hypothetical protein
VPSLPVVSQSWAVRQNHGGESQGSELATSLSMLSEAEDSVLHLNTLCTSLD